MGHPRSWLLGNGQSRRMMSLQTLLSILLFAVLAFAKGYNAQETATNSTDDDDDDDEGRCDPGLVLPVWLPQDDLSTGDRFARGLAYFLAMIYMFIGVSIISDRFMASIEVITSKEKEIKVKRPNGETQIVVVRVWNETVANLTLMALGSSAPEILLSIIEIYAKNFEPGDLGPGTIVGSAAFNLLVIIAICVYVIPDGEVRKIKHLRVFAVTATWSIFAYLWLLVILKFITPGVVDLWEGIITFLFFPATVITAYIADRRLLIYKYLHKGYRLNKRGVIVEGEIGSEMDKVNVESGGLRIFEEENVSDEVREFEESRRDYIKILRELRKKHPDIDAEHLETMARSYLIDKGPKSRAFYRMQATRKLMGGQNLMKKMQEKAASEASVEGVGRTDAVEKKEDDHISKIYFDPGHYTVLENVGEFHVTVIRDGGDPNLSILVDYKTEDGTASGDADYKSAAGTITFGPGETSKAITLEVIDDDVFEEDEHFYVRLSNARFADGSVIQANGAAGQFPKPQEVHLSTPFLATVIILDDDHCGIFNLGQKDIETVESIGVYDVKVTRWSGARGRVVVPYETEDGTAKAGKDFVHIEGEVIFENNETEKYIPVEIIEEDSYEKDVLFYLNLKEPKLIEDEGAAMALLTKDRSQLDEDEKIAIEGLPKLGSDIRAQIRVKESKEFKNTVDKLVQRANASLLVGTSSWKEQFIEAITVSAGDEEGGGDDEEEGEAEEKVPSCGDYVMHFLTIFWKILFAFVPPTDILGGYVAFVVSILVIGVLTAFIGDLASHLGCSVGLKDSVTAIAFVALGTSIPDTFASKVAAIQDEYADASVGNVTGSNAVNVFLGIGIAWTMAAIYHEFFKPANDPGCPALLKKGHPTCFKFYVDPGSLAYSVTVFCSVALVAIAVMVMRRHKAVGGELGGPIKFKYATSAFFFFLWVVYVFMSSLEAYGVVQGF
ncbi:sodium/calcium exchanger 3 isoform X1 [Folsomia candida]|uniref:sodium/calcium exchanger 3 isoform X1 n=1 Tax=Folsomia candida TaxID=158441 RepID=UPI000B8FCBBB|nr:sodium/calcium exchanger 3 isoform X1 [Folsomia candida]XP_035704661.1 sodium/calcium exchanger 3 isoform X1 [Folsomia candida]